MSLVKNVVSNDKDKCVDCSVCAEPFTSVVRTKISCGYCNYSACKTCVTRYLLSQVVDAHCMNCRTGWNREFLDQHMTKAFRTGAWRDHRKKMLVNREKAILPNFQQYAAAKKKMNELSPIVNTTSIELTNLATQRSTIGTKLYNTAVQMASLDATSDSINDNSFMKVQEENLKIHHDITLQWTLANAKYTRAYREYTTHSLIYNGVKKSTERREFIMKCVKEGCRGFLSQAYKCELCSTYVCKDCMIPKSEKNDDDHVCKKEDIESVTLIRKETHPCPKCGIRISKIDGCDMMWCTADGCGTAFSWMTGKIASGTIHNPHYYEWLRRNNNGQIPRQVGDVPCGGIPQIHTINSNLKTLGLTNPTTYNVYTVRHQLHGLYSKEINKFYEIHRCLSDIEHARIPQYNVTRDANLLKEVHVDYLLGVIDETKWTQSIFMKEANLEKKQLVCQVLNTFLNAGADILRNSAAILLHMVSDKLLDVKYKVDDVKMKPFIDNIAQLENLRHYINETLEKLAETAAVPVPQFGDSWYWTGTASAARIKAEREATLKAASKPATTT